MSFPAHISFDENGEKRIQTAAEHNRNTAQYAKLCLESVGAEKAGYLAGLLHDMGKFRNEFQDYLEKSAEGEMCKRGTVIHTFHACRYILEKFHKDTPDRYEDVTSELLAYAAAAHHGLFDCVDIDKKSGFEHRIRAGDINYSETVKNYETECASFEEISKLFSEANEELTAIYGKISQIAAAAENKSDELYFCFALLSRLMLSAVIEGDRHDTAEFMMGTLTRTLKVSPEFWEEKLEHVRKKLSEFPCNTPIDKARKSISDKCEEMASKGANIYRLNVPTGGGKTLSSLRFALKTAYLHNKKRIIFTSPLLSILEQNAAVLRKYIGDDTAILEHHSNVIKERENSTDYLDLAEDSWDAPIIITTLVQLLNTVFEGKTSCIRRFRALADSVVVIDEVQTVPNKMLSLFNSAVTFLSGVCNTTFVLCSATQPVLEKSPHPLVGRPIDIVPYDDKLWQVFRRTRVTYAGAKTISETADFAKDIMRGAKSLLIVCNKKDQAAELFGELNQSDMNCYHLSAAMCTEHRRNVLSKIKESLDSDERTVCVSTQVIEAGVDISFERVIRLAAGMDSIVQSAGRCNRNGELDGVADVSVVLCADENLDNLSEIKRAKAATIELLEEYSQCPQRYDGDLMSEKSIEGYYISLYRGFPQNFTDYCLDIDGKKTSLFNLLSENGDIIGYDCENKEKYFMMQSFSTAGDKFEVFDNAVTDVLAPYGEGTEIILELGESGVEYDPARVKKLLERSKPYAVSLYKWQLDKLAESGGVYDLCGGRIIALNAMYYDNDVGFVTEPGKIFLEV